MWGEAWLGQILLMATLQCLRTRTPSKFPFQPRAELS